MKYRYQMRREVRKPTAGLSKLLLTIHLVDGSNKLVVATEDFRVQVCMLHSRRCVWLGVIETMY